MKLFTYKSLVLALASIGIAHAAGLDRSGQDVTAFLQDGTYAEAVYTYIDADISGHDNGVPSASSTAEAYIKGKATGDVAEAYDFFRYAVKTDASDRISVGVLYDEPFGAAVNHQDATSNFITAGANATVSALTNGRIPNAAVASSNLSLLRAGFTGLQNLQAGIAQATAAGDSTRAATLQAQAQNLTTQLLNATGTTNLADAQAAATRLGAAVNAATTAATQQNQGTNVEIRTNNLTGLVGVKLGANKNFQVYGGAAAQRLTGEVHLRGTAYQGATGYDAKISPDTATGFVAGVAYLKPEIALKAALTYRSEIEHESQISESFPALGANGIKTQNFKVTLPESYNLDFQTGVNPTTLLTAKVRYVPWSDFAINPTLYTATTGTPIVSYSDDQWQAELGLGKKLSDKLSVSGSVGYDSGAGNPVSTLGPVKGYYSVGLGAKYNVTPEWSLSLGGKYLQFGDATAQLPNKAVAGH